jgi:3',5'-cyclic AMP phosphodiesterase CpdA
MRRRSFLATLLPALGGLMGASAAGELLARAAQSHAMTPALETGAAHNNAVFRFAALGDTGTGGEGQWEVARRMTELHDARPFGTVLLLGDNLYPDGDPAGFREKFERPYAELLRRGVRFHAVLGNHDVKGGRSAQINYDGFNMGGRSYYSFAEAGGMVEFFALDSNAMGLGQTAWLDGALAASKATWKIAFLHHPPYSSGMKHGSSTALRSVVEPLFVRHGVAAVFSGHDHVYERIKRQGGVQYFVSGAGGQLRRGGLDRSSPLFEAGDDQVNSFISAEVTPDSFRFRAVGADGRTLDEGSLALVRPSVETKIIRDAKEAASEGCPFWML